MRSKTMWLTAALFSMICLVARIGEPTDDETALPIPPEIGDGWQTASMAEAGMDSSQISRLDTSRDGPKLVLARPVIDSPGTTFAYSCANTMLLSVVIQSATPCGQTNTPNKFCFGLWVFQAMCGNNMETAWRRQIGLAFAPARYGQDRLPDAQ
jgi:hypothetical protein